MVGNFRGGANFCGKSEKALRINFYGFKFRDSSRGAALIPLLPSHFCKLKELGQIA
jgi:hypothetical protein